MLLASYDWRLSNRYNGQRLGRLVSPVLERLRSLGGEHAHSRVVFICHSMGGLVARWYIEMCGGAEITRKLITIGTPWRGAAMAVDKLVNGIAPKFSSISDGITEFSRSLPSLYQLLPEYAAVLSGSEYRKLNEIDLPKVLDQSRVADAFEFYDLLSEAETNRNESTSMTHMIVGTRQPTITTITFSGEHAFPSKSFRDENDFGDGTVPLSGGVGLGQSMDSNLFVRVPDYHGNLQCNPFVFDQIEAIFTANPVRRRGIKQVMLRVDLPEMILRTEELPVSIDIDTVMDNGKQDTSSGRYNLFVTLYREGVPKPVAVQNPVVANRHATVVFRGLTTGVHTVMVGGVEGSPLRPVTGTTLVWDAQSRPPDIPVTMPGLPSDPRVEAR